MTDVITWHDQDDDTATMSLALLNDWAIAEHDREGWAADLDQAKTDAETALRELAVSQAPADPEFEAVITALMAFWDNPPRRLR